jgi:hypothetical protein
MSTEIQAGQKQKTDQFKHSNPFTKRIFKYRHGIVCAYCERMCLVESFSSGRIKYCSAACRKLKTKENQRHRHQASIKKLSK